MAKTDEEHRKLTKESNELIWEALRALSDEQERQDKILTTIRNSFMVLAGDIEEMEEDWDNRKNRPRYRLNPQGGLTCDG